MVFRISWSCIPLVYDHIHVQGNGTLPMDFGLTLHCKMMYLIQLRTVMCCVNSNILFIGRAFSIYIIYSTDSSPESCCPESRVTKVESESQSSHLKKSNEKRTRQILKIERPVIGVWYQSLSSFYSHNVVRWSLATSFIVIDFWKTHFVFMRPLHKCF